MSEPGAFSNYCRKVEQNRREGSVSKEYVCGREQAQG